MADRDGAVRLKGVLEDPQGLYDFEVTQCYSFEASEERVLVDLLQRRQLPVHRLEIVLRALGHASGDRGVAVLHGIAHSHSEITVLRLAALEALSVRLREKATADLVAILNADARKELRRSAILMLAAFGDETAWSPVYELLASNPRWLLVDSTLSIALMFILRLTDGAGGARTVAAVELIRSIWKEMDSKLQASLASFWPALSTLSVPSEAAGEPDVERVIRFVEAIVRPWVGKGRVPWSTSDIRGETRAGYSGASLSSYFYSESFTIEGADSGADREWATSTDGPEFVVALSDAISSDSHLTERVLEFVGSYPGVRGSYLGGGRTIVVSGPDVNIQELGERLLAWLGRRTAEAN